MKSRTSFNGLASLPSMAESSQLKTVLLLAYGNLSRGDDALAPLLIDRIQQQGIASSSGYTLKYCQDYQIQIEHVMDMQQCERVILMDASQSLQKPIDFYPVQESAETCYTTHGMSASNLLHTYRQVHHEAPPDTYMLAIQGIQFELGQPLSSQAKINLNHAFVFLTELLSGGDTQPWAPRKELRAENF